MNDVSSILSISESIKISLCDKAMFAYPMECCGLLVGHRTSFCDKKDTNNITISSSVSTNNLAINPDRAFEIDPVTHITLIRNLRSQMMSCDFYEQIVGHYHSHPDSSSLPSINDLTRATIAETVWLIISISSDGIGDIDAWKAVSGKNSRIEFQKMRIQNITTSCLE
ncbi:MAG: M67 family metallopeptidase [Rhodospirillaceae bacterium]|nr:M67 family metallopeptidase [Rhodospirillaceae bacterium]